MCIQMSGLSLLLFSVSLYFLSLSLFLSLQLLGCREKSFECAGASSINHHQRQRPIFWSVLTDGERWISEGKAAKKKHRLSAIWWRRQWERATQFESCLRAKLKFVNLWNVSNIYYLSFRTCLWMVITQPMRVLFFHSRSWQCMFHVLGMRGGGQSLIILIHPLLVQMFTFVYACIYTPK